MKKVKRDDLTNFFAGRIDTPKIQCNPLGTVWYFHEFPLTSKIFRETKVQFFFKPDLQIGGFCLEKYILIKKYENQDYRANFISIVRVENFEIDQFNSEQLRVQVCKLWRPVKTFLFGPVQRSQLIWIFWFFMYRIY